MQYTVLILQWILSLNLKMEVFLGSEKQGNIQIKGI